MPGTTVGTVDTDRAALELPLTEDGLTEAVTPAGAPLTVIAMDVFEPLLMMAVLTVAVVDEPAATVPEDGLTCTWMAGTWTLDAEGDGEDAVAARYGARTWAGSGVPAAWVVPVSATATATAAVPAPASRARSGARTGPVMDRAPFEGGGTSAT
ncbi:hypothetical protein Kpho02_75840 [Kitasatospora phosalacinea]|uniref:Uncharacterized protein n=1 Tax=Kitasatospora phosalacinea TaxID=2065 RepID=A0A9W6V7I6_9ACTN|nr:hypothetical protein Kpho02_75840 [Kitasatospora phosalacinea]